VIEKIITVLAGFVIATISNLGYGGIMLLMAIESACIPLPSEIIMPFAGYLVFKGEMQLWAVALAGAVGCVLGTYLFPIMTWRWPTAGFNVMVTSPSLSGACYR